MCGVCVCVYGVIYVAQIGVGGLCVSVSVISLTSSTASWILALRGTSEHTTASSQKRKRKMEERQPLMRSHWMMQTASTWTWTQLRSDAHSSHIARPVHNAFIAILSRCLLPERKEKERS